MSQKYALVTYTLYMSLRLLEVYVHDEKVYNGTEAADRWDHMCRRFGWKEKWNKETEIPNVVKYIDDKADDSDLYSDLDDVRECLKENRDQLNHYQLSKDDCSRILLDMLDQIMLPLQQKELPDDFIVEYL